MFLMGASARSTRLSSTIGKRQRYLISCKARMFFQRE